MLRFKETNRKGIGKSHLSLKELNLFVFLLIAPFLTTLLTASAFGSAYTLGVKRGDYARYEYVEIKWEGEKPVEVIVVQRISWIELKVLNISKVYIKRDYWRFKVDLLRTVHYKDGREERKRTFPFVGTYYHPNYRDIELTEVGYSYFLIPAGLGKGDYICGIERTGAARIKDSSMKIYCGSLREVNYVSEEFYNGIWEAYYDKDTGILCEARIIYKNLDSYTITLKIKETNVFPVWSYLWFLTIPIVAVSVMAGILILRRRKRYRLLQKSRRVGKVET